MSVSFVSFYQYFYRKLKQTEMKFLKGLLSVVLVTFFIVGCNSESSTDKTTNDSNKTTPTKSPSSKTSPANNQGLINWVKIDEVEGLAKKNKKKIMVDLYTSWCGWCKRMDKATFQHGEIAQYVNDNFYAVKFNAEDKNSINFNGKAHDFVQAGRRGYNQLAFQFANGRMSYPTISFLDENLNVINAFPGYKEPNKFDPLLRFINEDHYKTQTLAQFQSGYQSSIPALPKPNRPKRNVKPQKGTQKIPIKKK